MTAKPFPTTFAKLAMGSRVNYAPSRKKKLNKKTQTYKLNHL